YRRWGHNEGDEPSYTQPVMAQKIKEHPRVRELLVQELVEKEMLTKEDAQAIEDEIVKELKQTHERVEARETVEDLGMRTDFVLDQDLKTTPDTTISEEVLTRINTETHRLPDTFTAHPK